MADAKEIEKKGLDERTYGLLMQANREITRFAPEDAVLLLTHLPPSDRLAWIQAWREKKKDFFERYDARFLSLLKQGRIYSPPSPSPKGSPPLVDPRLMEIYAEKGWAICLGVFFLFCLANPPFFAVLLIWVYALYRLQAERLRLADQPQYEKLHADGLAVVRQIGATAKKSTVASFYENMIVRLTQVEGVLKELASCSRKMHDLLRGTSIDNLEVHVNELSIFLLKEENPQVRFQLEEQMELALQTLAQRERVEQNYKMSLERQRHLNLKIENMYQRIGVYESNLLATGGVTSLQKSLDLEMKELDGLFALARQTRDQFDPLAAFALKAPAPEKKGTPVKTRDYLASFEFPEADESVNIGREPRKIELDRKSILEP